MNNEYVRSLTKGKQTNLCYCCRIHLQGPGELREGRLLVLYEELFPAQGAGEIHYLQQIPSSCGLHVEAVAG